MGRIIPVQPRAFGNDRKCLACVKDKAQPGRVFCDDCWLLVSPETREILVESYRIGKHCHAFRHAMVDGVREARAAMDKPAEQTVMEV